MDVLEKVKAFAEQAHDGQMRKFTPERYINHPIRVMDMCREVTDHLPILAAALLHDVLEDTKVDRDELNSFLRDVMSEEDASRTFQIVNDLTDIYTKACYPAWNRRKRKAAEADRLEQTSADSQTVRYADIIDNAADMGRQWEDDFAERFLKECRSLLKRLQKGNKQLYERAVRTVDESLRQISEQQERRRYL